MADPASEPSKDKGEENIGDRWLYNGVVFFLILPFSVYMALTSNTLIGSIISAGFGGSLTLWRISVTPRIRNVFNLNFTFKGKKQLAKDSPGASLVQAENYYNLPSQDTTQLPEDLAKAYGDFRKTVMGWSDLAYSRFYEWKDLYVNDFRLVSKIKRDAPDLYALCDQASKLFEEISPLRAQVGAYVREEQLRLAQEYQSRFDNGSKVESPWLRIKVDEGNERPLYLEHAWAFGLKTRDWAGNFAKQIIQNSKSWSLELIVQGRQMGNTETRAVASGDEAISFGDRVLGFLEKQPSALQLTKKLEKTLQLKEQLIPRLEKELSKG